MARELGMDPVEFRLRNLVRPEQMPFENITAKHFDSGDYPECLRRAAAALDARPARDRRADRDLPHGSGDGSGTRDETGGGPPGAPAAGRDVPGRYVGAGFSVFCEQAAHGTSVYAAWGVPMVPGHEQATARLTPDGGLELRVGVHSHGQGLETTLAQVAHEILGIDNREVKVVHGDTASTPYSDRHLGVALHGDGGRGGGDRLRGARGESEAPRRPPPPGRSRRGRAARTAAHGDRAAAG